MSSAGAPHAACDQSTEVIVAAATVATEYVATETLGGLQRVWKNNVAVLGRHIGNRTKRQRSVRVRACRGAYSNVQRQVAVVVGAVGWRKGTGALRPASPQDWQKTEFGSRLFFAACIIAPSREQEQLCTQSTMLWHTVSR